ncbi:MAG: FecR domain-containing protein [Cyclobacteriaceae bacterium]|nr:FecR domain-containing protein [Cyclobacteriaceae bacterium]
MSNIEIYKIIAKSLAGEAKPEEQQQLSEWENAKPEHRQLIKRFEAIWKETHWKDQYNHQDTIFKTIQRRIDKKYDQDFYQDRYWSWHKTSDLIRSGLAASIALVMAVSLVFFPYQQKSKVEQEAPSYVLKENLTRQKSRIPLPDGSVAWLNAESSIRYLEGFQSDVRRIELDGEAFFEVAENPRKPFEVVSGDILTTALGTSFNVRNFKNQDKTSVFLNSGVVRIQNLNRTAKAEVLDPGQGITYDRKQGTIDKFLDMERNAIAWKDGILRFDGSDLMAVIDELSIWYGVEIEIRGRPGPGWRYTGEFKNEYLSNVLNSMAYAKNFNYVIDSQKVVITF